MTRTDRQIEDAAGIAKRREIVAELVAAGKSERDIANQLGVSRTTVWTDKQVNAAAAVKA